MEGVIVEDENGDYKKITASKAVLLATGDYASNAEMMSYYVPWSDRFMSIFPNVDAKGEKTNTGDGQQIDVYKRQVLVLSPGSAVDFDEEQGSTTARARGSPAGKRQLMTIW